MEDSQEYNDEQFNEEDKEMQKALLLLWKISGVPTLEEFIQMFVLLDDKFQAGVIAYITKNRMMICLSYNISPEDDIESYRIDFYIGQLILIQMFLAKMFKRAEEYKMWPFSQMISAFNRLLDQAQVRLEAR